jgi:nucleoside-diphosphate-sugar epimerase
MLLTDGPLHGGCDPPQRPTRVALIDDNMSVQRASTGSRSVYRRCVPVTDRRPSKDYCCRPDAADGRAPSFHRRTGTRPSGTRLGSPRLMRRMRLAVIGGSGFVGSHVVSEALSNGLDAVQITAPRLEIDQGEVSIGGVQAWPHRLRPQLQYLSDALAGSDVVVNAAGLARPGSLGGSALYAANAVLPGFVATACRAAGVRRMVHVSTAAVQGRLDPLDESVRHFPFSPYSRSKADGEQWLLTSEDRPDEVVIYRPTSVHGRQRNTTRGLAKYASSPLVPIAGAGDQPLPVALIENVAAGLVFAATCPSFTRVMLQPPEGLTTRRLLEIFGSRRFVSLPTGLTHNGLRLVRRLSDAVPVLSTPVRSFELLYRGQGVVARSLPAAGFVPPAGESGWVALGAGLRPAIGHPSSVSGARITQVRGKACGSQQGTPWRKDSSR